MVQRRHAEDPLPVSRKDATWTMTETVSSHEQPTDDGESTSSCLVTTEMPPSAPPHDNDPVSPMKTMAGGALNQRKTETRADQRAAEDGQLAAAGYGMELQIAGKDRIADQIGDQREATGRDHNRHDGQAVQPIGQVHRVRRTDH